MIPLFAGGGGEGRPMLYRITIKRDGATITTLTLQTDDPEQAKRMARLDFDLQRRQRNATAVILTDQDGRVVYSYPQSDPA
jgi:hypothetical protein